VRRELDDTVTQQLLYSSKVDIVDSEGLDLIYEYVMYDRVVAR
jgi:hypothetical protein